FRQNQEIVGSAPANCDYDPFTGEWRNGGNRGLFEEKQDEQLVKQHSRYFDVISHALHSMPQAYVPLLDAIVERACDVMGVARPDGRIRYFFYPSMQELQAEISLPDGVHVSGLTEYGGQAGREIATIRTAFPGHAHEVLHALLQPLNPEPRFFVSEACATILGACWGTEDDLESTALSLRGEVRVTTMD